MPVYRYAVIHGELLSAINSAFNPHRAPVDRHQYCHLCVPVYTTDTSGLSCPHRAVTDTVFNDEMQLMFLLALQQPAEQSNHICLSPAYLMAAAHHPAVSRFPGSQRNLLWSTAAACN